MAETTTENAPSIDRDEVIMNLIATLPDGVREEAYADILDPEVTSEQLDALAFG